MPTKPPSGGDGELFWDDIVDRLKPYVVKVSTPQGMGTGFLIWTSADFDLSVVATAAHVVGWAEEWNQPVKLFHPESGKSAKVQGDNHVLQWGNTDTAIIFLRKNPIPFPKEPLEMIAEGDSLRVGNEIGWLGFPSISPENICLFSGRISLWLEAQRAYYVDGVAIHGVSGGPAFYPSGDSFRVVGFVSEYRPNRATGEALPGMCILRDVGTLQQFLKGVRSVEEAQRKVQALAGRAGESGTLTRPAASGGDAHGCQDLPGTSG